MPRKKKKKKKPPVSSLGKAQATSSDRCDLLYLSQSKALIGFIITQVCILSFFQDAGICYCSSRLKKKNVILKQYTPAPCFPYQTTHDTAASKVDDPEEQRANI